MAKVFNLKSISAAVAGAAPVLYALVAVPGDVGKIASVIVGVLVAVGLLHAKAPEAK